MHLEATAMARVEALKKELAEMEVTFSSNIAEDATTHLVHEADLEGCPDAFVKSLDEDPQGSGMLVLRMDYPHVAAMKNCRVPSTRKAMEEKFNSRCKLVNAPLLEQICAKRHEKGGQAFGARLPRPLPPDDAHGQGPRDRQDLSPGPERPPGSGGGGGAGGAQEAQGRGRGGKRRGADHPHVGLSVLPQRGRGAKVQGGPRGAPAILPLRRRPRGDARRLPRRLRPRVHRAERHPGVARERHGVQGVRGRHFRAPRVLLPGPLAAPGQVQPRGVLAPPKGLRPARGQGPVVSAQGGPSGSSCRHSGPLGGALGPFSASRGHGAGVQLSRPQGRRLAAAP
mmetsp:Transcript_67432/g.152616  ORF Transcript_67432/g.152616 Transcript_67432/m.152616 type:complete len:340 (+) Transcript_67432:199-1218(+)